MNVNTNDILRSTVNSFHYKVMERHELINGHWNVRLQRCKCPKESFWIEDWRLDSYYRKVKNSLSSVDYPPSPPHIKFFAGDRVKFRDPSFEDKSIYQVVEVSIPNFFIRITPVRGSFQPQGFHDPELFKMVSRYHHENDISVPDPRLPTCYSQPSRGYSSARSAAAEKVEQTDLPKRRPTIPR
jgi:hypothetical protein